MEKPTCPQCKAPLGAAGPAHRCTPTPDLAPTVKQVDPTAKLTPSVAKSGVAKSAARPAPKPDASAALRKATDAPPPNLEQLLTDPSKVVNQYVLAGMLGQGGMGQVWKAWDTKLSRWTALKFLTVSDPASRKRFEREAKLAARLRHPNIAAVYEVGQDQGRDYIAMEYVDGLSLGKANLSTRDAAQVIGKIARALEEAHKEGVIHRDLKPDNLMITKAGRPYVMDFGLAKTVEAESSLSVSGDVMGTPAFMSPEQARGDIETIDGRTDVYSLGATLYTLLTGEKPFQGKTSMEIVMKVVNQEPVPPSRLKADLPPALDAIVLKAMDKDRERRYPTAAALGDDLDRYLANQEVVARPPSFSRLAVVRLKRHAWPATLAGVLILAVGVGLLSRGNPPPAAPASDWLAAFREGRQSLEYRQWKPEDTAASARIRELLGRTEGRSPEGLREAADWLRKEIELGEGTLELWSSRPHSEWSKLREQAERTEKWSQAALGATQGQTGEFTALAGRLGELRRGAQKLAQWRGEFTLRVAVVPFGQVTSLKRGGQDLPLKDRETPLVLPDLEIGDYEIDLAAASQPPLHLVIPAERLRDGVTSTLVGDLRKSGSVQIVP